jgi:hypothetical protein
MRQAEGVGFEPTEHFCSRVFETRALGRTMLPLLAKLNYSTAIAIRQTAHLLLPDPPTFVLSTTRKWDKPRLRSGVFSRK